MSKKDDDNPFEEMQKQLSDLFKNKNVQVAFAPFMQSMAGNDDATKKEKGGTRESPPEEPEPTRDEKLDSIRAFNRKPKEIRDYLFVNRCSTRVSCIVSQQI